MFEPSEVQTIQVSWIEIMIENHISSMVSILKRDRDWIKKIKPCGGGHGFFSDLRMLFEHCFPENSTSFLEEEKVKILVRKQEF